MALGTELQRLFVRISADTSDFKAGLNEIEGSLSNMTNRLQRAGSTFNQAGMALTAGLTVPIVGLGIVAAKASIDFESAFAGVKKTVDATDAQFAQMRQGIRDMAKEMPASATAISKVAESAGQLGIAREDILSFTETMIKVGTATNLTADEAATAFARLGNIMQIPTADIDNLASALVELGNKGASTESEIMEMALRIAGAGHQVGLSGDQVLAFANALSSVGIEAESGGTAISRAFIEIANSVADGGDKLELFAKVAGMSADQFAQAFKTDAAGAMISFIEGLKRVSDSGENVFAVLDGLDLGEIRVRDALLRASGAGDLFRQSLEDGARAMQQNIALDVEYEKRKETTAAKLEILKNRLMDVAITLGDALIPALIKAIDASEPFFKAIQFLAEGFAALPQPVQFLIIALAGLAAVIGPLLIVIGGMVTGLGAIGSVLGVLGISFAGGTIAVGGLAAAFGALLVAALPWIALAAVIAGGLYLLITNWDAVTAAVSRAARAVRDVLVAAFNTVLNFLRGNWQEVATLVSGPFAPLVALATDAFGIRTALVNAFSDIIGFMAKVPGYIINALGDLSSLLYNAGVQIITGLWKGMADRALGMLDWVSDLAGKIASLKGPLSKDKRLLIPQGQAIIEGLASGLERGFDRTMKPLLKDLTSTLQDTWAGTSMAMPALAVDSGGQSSGSGINTNKKVPRELQNNTKAVQASTDAASMTWQQINDMPDEWRQANKEMILALGKKLGYQVFEDMSIAGPGTKAYASTQSGTWDKATKKMPAAGTVLASTGDQVSSGLIQVGDSAEKTAKTLDSLTKSVKKPSTPKSTEGMVKAEDGSMVPASFYDQTDLTPVKKPTAAKSTAAKTTAAPASAADALDKAATAAVKATPALTDTTKATNELMASLDKVSPAADKSALSFAEVGDTAAAAAPKQKSFSLGLGGVFQAMKDVNGGAHILAGLSDAFDWMKNVNGLDKIGDAIGKALDGAGEKLSDFKDSAFSKAGEIGASIMDGLSGALSSAGGFAGGIGEGIASTVSGAFESAKTAAGEGISGLISFIGENFTAYNLGQALAWFLLWPVALFREAFGAVAPVVVTFFGSTLPAAISSAIPAIGGAIAQVGTSMLSAWMTAAEASNTFVRTTLPAAISSAAESIATAALGIGTSIVNGIAGGLASASGAINTFMRATLPGMVNSGAGAVAQAAVAVGSTIIRGIVSSVTGQIAAIRALPGLIAGVFTSAFNAMGSVWEGIGKAIMNGIWNGMSGMMSWISQQFTSFLSGLWNRGMSIIGAHSPSKLFAKMGKSIMDGVGVGLADSYPAVSGGLNKMLTGMASGPIPGMAMPASLFQPASAPASARIGYRSPSTNGSNGGGLTVQAYGTVINNNAEKQDVNKALGNITFAMAAELRSRGVLV